MITWATCNWTKWWMFEKCNTLEFPELFIRKKWLRILCNDFFTKKFSLVKQFPFLLWITSSRHISCSKYCPFCKFWSLILMPPIWTSTTEVAVNLELPLDHGRGKQGMGGKIALFQLYPTNLKKIKNCLHFWFDMIWEGWVFYLWIKSLFSRMLEFLLVFFLCPFEIT
jgi:hypothetical protein